VTHVRVFSLGWLLSRWADPLADPYRAGVRSPTICILSNLPLLISEATSWYCDGRMSDRESLPTMRLFHPLAYLHILCKAFRRSEAEVIIGLVGGGGLCLVYVLLQTGGSTKPEKIDYMALKEKNGVFKRRCEREKSYSSAVTMRDECTARSMRGARAPRIIVGRHRLSCGCKLQRYKWEAPMLSLDRLVAASPSNRWLSMRDACRSPGRCWGAKSPDPVPVSLVTLA
jgi:hypothetical protein